VQDLAAHVLWLKERKRPPPAIHELRDAWFLRRNCHEWAHDKVRANKDKVEAALPDVELLDAKNTEPVHLFVARHQWSSMQALKRDFEKQAKHSQYMVQITCTERNSGLQVHRDDKLKLFTAVESPTSLRFMEALQDLMIEKCRKRRLVFEVNPTSNRHIGSMSEVRDHPIFRWTPPDPRLLEPGEKWNQFALRKGPLEVCINTDDPGIMPTTLRTEFELLRHAALDHGAELQDVYRWLTRLRRKGLRLFRDAHAGAATALPPHWMDVA
jgi:hypothetical protein